MIDHIRTILSGQYLASLAMLNQCLVACPEEHWEGKIANGPFRWVAYHTLFFTDYYLSPGEDAFVTRDLHKIGGDELGEAAAPGLPKPEALAYAQICREKVGEVLAKETPESLQAPCGFRWRKFSRGELHLYNIRHIQHHTGQMSAYLRRVVPGLEHKALPSIGSGWR